MGYNNLTTIRGEKSTRTSQRLHLEHLNGVAEFNSRGVYSLRVYGICSFHAHIPPSSSFHCASASALEAILNLEMNPPSGFARVRLHPHIIHLHKGAAATKRKPRKQLSGCGMKVNYFIATAGHIRRSFQFVYSTHTPCTHHLGFHCDDDGDVPFIHSLSLSFSLVATIQRKGRFAFAAVCFFGKGGGGAVVAAGGLESSRARIWVGRR